MARAFDGVRILDLSRLLPGPYCSLLFADLGADVIKVEEPGRGDYARVTPPLVGDPGIGAYFLLLNRNKRSVAVDLKTETGRVVFRRLAATADILLESFRPGVMDRLGLGWNELRHVNPRLVYCALSGYGQDGPYRDVVGHDVNYMGVAGALSMTGPRGGAPMLSGIQAADLGGGALLAAFAISAALHHRNASGQGQFVDVSMTDGVVSWMAPYLGAFLAGGRLPARGEERLNGGWPCYGIYETADGGHVTLGALEPQFWRNFCRLVEREDLVPLQRVTGEGRERVETELRALFRTRRRDDWVRLLHSADVCAGPVLTLDEVPQHPQIAHRGLFATMPHPTLGSIPQIAFPAKLSETPARMEAPPPALGQHTDEVLRAIGYDEGAVAALRRDGVVA